MQMMLKSTNGGESWTAISPDLTRNDKSKQQVSGGPIQKDDTGTEYYDTVFTHRRIAGAEGPDLGREATMAWCTSRAMAAATGPT